MAVFSAGIISGLHMFVSRIGGHGPFLPGNIERYCELYRRGI
jgi:hypothetical protein